MREYYKVITRERTSLYAHHPKWQRYYPVNEWVYARNNSRLFVFDTLKHAEYFSKCSDWKIVPCICVDPIPLLTRSIVCAEGKDSNLSNFWTFSLACERIRGTEIGTLGAKRIKCLR